jgi:glycosyltransferase involved in cell wall biosynthesis
VDPVGAKAGMDWYNLLLLRSLADQGVRTLLLSNFDRQDNRVTVINVFRNISNRRLISLLKIFRGILLSLRHLCREKVTVVILHVFRGDWLELLISSVFFYAGFKVCLIIHDIESLDTASHSLARKWLLTCCHHFKVVHNEFSKQELIKTLRQIDETSISVIPHGEFSDMIASPDEITDSNDPAFYDPERINLLFFGQIKKTKGLGLLLEALQQVDGRFHLVIAGKSRDDHLDNYRLMLGELLPAGKVKVLNRHVSDAERDYLFRHCDVVVLPYLRIYQSGVLLLAMSYGKAIIASDVPPFKEIIRHGENGLLFQCGNAKDLAYVISQLPDLNLKELGKAARNEAVQRFNWKDIGTMYVRLFSQTTADRNTLQNKTS